jgi:anti-sigma regulatory factor (Ser/Thr protein kinase)
VTALVAVIDPVVGTLHYASAGHPLPLLRDAEGRVRELAGPAGPPLGLRAGTGEPARTIALEPGCTLVLFTDGLTEATRDLGAGERRLRDAVAALGDVPAESSDARALRDAILSDGAPDDVAILVVRYTGRTQVLRWSFESADAGAARATRLEMVHALERAGANAEQIANAELVYSELIGNVVRHAPGPVEVALDVGGRAPILHVLDRGPSFVADPREQRDVLAERGRGLFIASHLTDGLQISARHDGGSHARATLVPPSRGWAGGLTSML